MMEATYDHNLAVFGRWIGFWRDRWHSKGEAYSGGVEQTRTIEGIIRGLFSPKHYYPDAMDFGAGHGRFCELMSLYCGHIWAADIVDDMLDCYGSKAPTVTPMKLEWPVKLPLRDDKLDLLWAFFTFQHIVDPTIFQLTTQELRRVLKSGSRILIIDNAVDTANHVRSRGPEALGKALGMKPGFTQVRVTIGNPHDHWLIDGVKA